MLKDLVLLIAEEPGGFDIAVDILYMRLYSDRSAGRDHDLAVLEAGQELLQQGKFLGNNQLSDHRLAGVANSCLSTSDGGPIAAGVAMRLIQAVASREAYASDHDELLGRLLKVQPSHVLDALFAGEGNEHQAAIRVFEQLGSLRENPIDAVSSDFLIAWCDQDPVYRYPMATTIPPCTRIAGNRRCNARWALAQWLRHPPR
jgi:hypothetical protein